MSTRMARKVILYFQGLKMFQAGQVIEVKKGKTWCGKSEGSRGTLVAYRPARIGPLHVQTTILAVRWDNEEAVDWGIHMHEKLSIVSK